jgi:hypothetical protein
MVRQRAQYVAALGDSPRTRNRAALLVGTSTSDLYILGGSLVLIREHQCTYAHLALSCLKICELREKRLSGTHSLPAGLFPPVPRSVRALFAAPSSLPSAISRDLLARQAPMSLYSSRPPSPIHIRILVSISQPPPCTSVC